MGQQLPLEFRGAQSVVRELQEDHDVHKLV